MGIYNSYNRYNAELLKSYFKDNSTYNFKYGLDFGLVPESTDAGSNHSKFNLDEDPTIFGFDMYILPESPLFNDMNPFFDFGVENNIPDIVNRRDMYADLLQNISKFIDVGQTSTFGKPFKTHYIESVTGLAELVKSIGIEEETSQFTQYGKDKLTIGLSEDVNLNSGYLAKLYRDFVYRKVVGRMVVPENLLRFNLVIVISEVRKFTRVANTLKSIAGTRDKIRSFLPDPFDRIPEIEKAQRVFKDNISRYIITLSECSFDFNKMSFSDALTIAGFGKSKPDISDGLTFDIYYKYSGMEMEKFDFKVNTDDIKKYLSDSSVKPDTYQNNPNPNSNINRTTDASIIDKTPNRPFDLPYHLSNKDNTSDIIRKYQFDFPMIKANYSIQESNRFRANIENERNASPIRRGINKLVDSLNRNLQTKVSQARSILVSRLVAEVRETVAFGLRNISAPQNVYVGTKLGQYLNANSQRGIDLEGLGNGLKDAALSQLGGFANVGVSGVLGKLATNLNKQSAKIEGNIFNRLNNITDSITGIQRGGLAPDVNAPNVYRK